MKKLTIPLVVLLAALFGNISLAQDILVPAGAESVGTEQTVASQTDTPNEASKGVDDASLAPADGMEPAEQPATIDLAAQLVAFFDGLDAAAAGDDCNVIAQALTNYCSQNQAWIDSLDYATGNIDNETIQTLHEKAESLGKRLSACYDNKSIPELLKRYAGIR